MVGPRLTLDPKSSGQDWLCGNGGKCKVKGALVFSSSNLANAPAVLWGGAGWGLQQLQGEAEEMTVRGLERSREAHKVFLGLRLVSARSFPGLAPAQLSRFKDRGPGCAQ